MWPFKPKQPKKPREPKRVDVGAQDVTIIFKDGHQEVLHFTGSVDLFNGNHWVWEAEGSVKNFLNNSRPIKASNGYVYPRSEVYRYRVEPYQEHFVEVL